MTITVIPNVKIKFIIPLLDKKKYKIINYKDIEIQKMFVHYIIKNKNINDYNTINKYFVDDFGENLKLNKNQISKIKNKLYDEFKDLNLIELIEKIKVNIPDLYINIFDIKYELEIKNKKVIRDNRIIFFGIKNNLDLIKPNSTEEFFADTTFKIIPSGFRPYKLFIISGIAKIDKKPKIYSMILTKYTDNISYGKIFDYLFENTGFKPKILHTDFEISLSHAIKQNKNIGEGIIHTHCFFHYSSMIKKNLGKTGIYKKRLNKLSVEIITNLEILCFINLENIKEFQNLILKKLETYKNMDHFIKYLKNYLFKLSPKIYNYSALIKHFQKDESNNIFLEKLYTTNNICESL